MRMQVRSLASLSGLRIQCCHELQCRSQMRLDLAVTSSYSSDLTPSLGTSICCRCVPKKQKKGGGGLPIYTKFFFNVKCLANRKCLINISSGFFVFSFFLGPHLWHMEVLRLGVESNMLLQPRPQFEATSHP